MSSQDNIVLVFDTETSGLFKEVDNIDKCPRITQLSYILYNVTTNETLEVYNQYVQQSASMDFSSKAFEITKITKEMCDGGVTIREALTSFFRAYMRANEIIAHNIEFDKKMIQSEVIRESLIRDLDIEYAFMFNEMFNKVRNKKIYCTMQSGKSITDITITGKHGIFKKPPKLSELYEKLFGSVPENLHDSSVDTLICLKCYLKIKYNHNL